MKKATIDLLIILSVIILAIPWVIRIQLKAKHNNTPDITKIEATKIQSILNGKDLFIKEQCISCHKPTKTDYRMRGVTDRYERKFLIQFIKNEDSLVTAKNQEVIALKEEYKWANGLHNKKHLTTSQVNDILNYLALFGK